MLVIFENDSVQYNKKLESMCSGVDFATWEQLMSDMW